MNNIFTIINNVVVDFPVICRVELTVTAALEVVHVSTQDTHSLSYQCN